jgi:N-acetylglucosamine kinase-like BadF-type ATPase
MADAPLVAAIDGGGSGSRGVLAAGPTLIARVEAGPLQLTTMDGRAIRFVLDTLLDELTRKADPRQIAGLCLGVAGAGNPERRSILEQWARERLPQARTSVCRDVDLVLAAGQADGTGIAAIAGTGAIVLGRNADGVERLADGRGPFVGDRGGGFQLGLDAIRLVLHALEAKRPAPQPLADVVCDTLGIHTSELEAVAVPESDGVPLAQVAALARRVCGLAVDGDTHSRRLVTAAAGELAASYRAVSQGLPGAEALLHLLAGGLATTPVYRMAFAAATGRTDWQVVADPVVGGLVLAATHDRELS